MLKWTVIIKSLSFIIIIIIIDSRSRFLTFEGEAAGLVELCVRGLLLRAPQWWSLTSATSRPTRPSAACRVTSEGRVTWRPWLTCHQRRAWRSWSQASRWAGSLFSEVALEWELHQQTFWAELDVFYTSWAKSQHTHKVDNQDWEACHAQIHTVVPWGLGLFCHLLHRRVSGLDVPQSCRENFLFFCSLLPVNVFFHRHGTFSLLLCAWMQQVSHKMTSCSTWRRTTLTESSRSTWRYAGPTACQFQRSCFSSLRQRTQLKPSAPRPTILGCQFAWPLWMVGGSQKTMI